MNGRGFNVSAMSAETGITRAAVSDYMTGRHYPPLDKAFLMAKALQVSLDWLTGLDDTGELQRGLEWWQV